VLYPGVPGDAQLVARLAGADPHLMTMTNLVCTGSGHEVCTVMIQGKVPVRENEVLVGRQKSYRAAPLCGIIEVG
jgi:hypothetical protein